MLVALKHHGGDCMSMYKALADISINAGDSGNIHTGSAVTAEHAIATLQALALHAIKCHKRYDSPFEKILIDISYVLDHMRCMQQPFDTIPTFVWNRMFEACASPPGGTYLYALQHVWDSFCCRKKLFCADSTLNSLVVCAANMRGGARRSEIEEAHGQFFLHKDHTGRFLAVHKRKNIKWVEAYLKANAQFQLGMSDPFGQTK